VRLLVVAACALAIVACGFGGQPAAPTAVPAPTPAPRPTAEAPAAVPGWYQAIEDEEAVRVRADLTAPEIDGLANVLAQRYPKLKIEWQRGADASLLQQTLSEARTNAPGWDVYIGDSAPTLTTARLALRWTPPEARTVAPEMIDPEGGWYGIAATYHVVQYNSEQVPQPASLNSYEALLDPNAFGRLSIEDFDLTWLQGLIELRGRDGASALIKGLAGQSVAFRNDQRTLVVFVTAGRNPVAIDARMDAVERERRNGGKTAWIGVDPVVVQPLAMAVSATTDRPNGAKVLANFLFSQDAQAIFAAAGRVPARTDTPPDPPTLIQGLHAHLTLPPVGAAERDLRELWLELWGRR
jgi:ABC-type Fe3+ transport system substrate-binding protein